MRTIPRRALALLPALLLLLAPPAARAFSIATIAGQEVRWKIDDVGYYLDVDGWTGISNGSDRQAVVQSFAGWQGVSCSYLKFHKLGDTSVSSVLSTGAEANGKNELIWKEGYWPFGNYVLGVTSPLFNFAGTINEADIAFNGTIYWNTNGSMWNSTDVKSVAIHEIGHFFGLQHNLAFNESDPPTMAPYADPYGKSATLHQDDKNAICYLYPTTTYTCTSASQCPYVVMDNAQGEEYYASHYKCSGGKCVPDTSSQPGQGDLGATCQDDNDCKAPGFCIQTTQGSWCTVWCDLAADDCPDDFACYQVEQGSDQGLCFGGNHDKDFGELCFTNSECKTGYFCMEWWSGPFCTKGCTDIDGGTGCPSGYTCYPSDTAPSAPGACYPGEVEKKANGASCSYSSDCASGLCFPTPGSTSKYCRDKCDPIVGSCPGATKCIGMPGDRTGKKGGCIPVSLLPEKKVGAACESAWQCASNYCYFDAELSTSTCRQPCTPGSDQCGPGEACFELGGGHGACLPAPEPQPEGGWCLHHYECLSGFCSPLPGTGKKACRNACTAGSGCPAGFECVFYADPDVGACMPQGKELGEMCSSSTECTTQVCWAPAGSAICLLPCVESQCPYGYACLQTSPYGPVCQPVGGELETGMSCTSGIQCASGVCLLGLCTPACDVAAGGCADGSGCVPLAAGPDGGCTKPGSRGEGEACANDFECATLLCVSVAGKPATCRLPCALAAPACSEDTVCVEPPALDGLGACVPAPPGNDKDEDPDNTPPADNDPGATGTTDPGFGCTAAVAPGAPTNGLLLLLCLLAAGWICVRRKNA